LKLKSRNINIGSILITWLLSYMSVLLIPLIINGIVYIKSSMILEGEINRVNMGMLKQLQSTIDSKLTDMDRLTQQISLEPNVNSLKSINNNFEGFQAYNIYKTAQNLKIYQSSNAFIDNLYIFLKGPKTILSYTTHSDSLLEYEYNLKYDNMTYNEWISLLNSTHKRDLVMLRSNGDSDGFDEQIAYVQSLPVENPNNSYATLVISINAKWFQDAIQNIELTNQGTTIIADNNNRILVSTKETDRSESIPYDKLTESSGIIYDTINGKKVVISYMTSSVAKWKYISMVPLEVFLNKMKYIQQLNRISLILCIILGGAVTFFFVRKNYKPINNIVKRLKERAGKSLNKAYNEYGFIMDSISATFDENDKINEQLEVQNKEMRANFFRRIFKGQLSGIVSINDALSSFNINLLSDKFLVMIFNIEECSKLFTDHKNMDDQAKREYSKFILVNVVEELANQDNQGFMIEVDDKMYACLVNLKSQDERNAKEGTVRIANEAQSFIQETFKMNFTVTISNIHSTIAGITEAYQEAMEVMEYKNVVGYAEIMHYDELSSTKYPKSSYLYPLETEYRLINSIKAGEFEKAKSIVDEVFDKNFSSKHISLKITKCFMFNMISTMLKALDEINHMYGNNYPESLNSMDKLLKCKTTFEIRSTLIESISNICNYVLSQKKDTHKELIDDIITFVDSNYNDVNFSITMIGEKFKMTPSYISKIFMEERGEGLLDYINTTRLERAKLLLREKKYSVNEVASMVGFGNNGTFIRAFKKYEGITPGKYN
jgi:AraC-like DNA-binding protein